MKYAKYFILSLLIIALDQTVKLLVHFNMPLHSEFSVFGDWFKIHYILNPGMAFGLKLDAEYGKLLLSVFRILATLGIAYYIKYLVDSKSHTGLVWCVAMILAGAVGNVIDSTFYGIFIVGNLPYDAPMALFHGQVIDMFYVDIWEGVLPTWIPLFGGQHYSFWPIFNVADASIFVGVAVILVMQKRFFSKKETESESNLQTVSNPQTATENNSDIS